MFAEVLKDKLSQVRSLLPPDLGRAGNIGMFAFVSGEHGFGLNAIAASFNIYQEVRAAIREVHPHGEYEIITNYVKDDGALQSGSGYEIYRHLIQDVGERLQVVPGRYSTTLRAGDERNYDSEYFIINYVQDYIAHYQVEGGTLHMITELPPCDDCIGVIEEFIARNKEVAVEVYHTKKSVAKQQSFASRLSPSGRATLSLV